MRYLISWMLVLSAGIAGPSAAMADRFEGLPDPTRPSGWRVEHAPRAGVQSILISPQRKVAVVHGQTVTVGDRVGDAVVVDIRPYEVILRRAGRETSLRLVPRLGTPASGGG
jgi:MSHA biogenesis protein MshK